MKHVDSVDNPADIASRGCPPSELIGNELWWHGSQCLKYLNIVGQNTSTPMVLRGKNSKKIGDLLRISRWPFTNFSSLTKVYRSHALKFWKNTGVNRRYLGISSIDLTSVEIRDGKSTSIIESQKFFYANVYVSLDYKIRISPSS